MKFRKPWRLISLAQLLRFRAVRLILKKYSFFFSISLLIMLVFFPRYVSDLQGSRDFIDDLRCIAYDVMHDFQNSLLKFICSRQKPPKLATLDARTQVILAENRHLKELLKYIEHAEFAYLSTSTVHISNSTFGKEFIVTAGRAEGVRLGNVVMNSDGMLGRVTKVMKYGAQVTPINHPSMRIAALLVNANKQCIIGGDVETGGLKVLYLDEAGEVESGDIAITSGVDGIIPAGIMVGKTFVVDRKIIIKPLADLEDVSIVVVALSPS